MRRPGKAGGKSAKTQRRKTLRRRNASKAVRRRSPRAAGEETNIARLTRELVEAREQQTATADVLKVISSSAGELQPVFETMLAKGVALCDASFGAMWLVEGDGYRTAALHGDLPAAYVEQWRSGTLHRPKAVVPMMRAIRSRKPVHVPDMRKEKAYLEGDPLPVSAADVAGIRTLVSVPMLKEDDAIGVITIYRKEVRPFTNKQIELVSNFAAQAVIAIENARLLNELRDRTTDLSESLEQQTATSEVLGVISSSPGELTLVFDAILANATRLCDAKFANLFLHQNGSFSVASQRNAPAAYREQWNANPHLKVSEAPNNPLARLAATNRVVSIADLTLERGYVERAPRMVTLVEAAGARSLLAVPMLKDSRLVGAIVIYRQEVRPFTNRQIELITNFADQAVIAIENARLLAELRGSLDRQTAMSEVLSVISSSPGELKPVFESMLGNAMHICEAQCGFIYRMEAGVMRAMAEIGVPPALAEYRRNHLHTGGATTPVDLMRATKKPAHVHDAREDAYRTGNPNAVAGVELGDARTVLYVPMLKEDEIVGVINVYRQEVRPFADDQIALLENFAAQAVIAIENTRLLNELRNRTTDLSEALEQQTATSEVLKVISSSPGELEAVFQAMLENATRICDAKFGNIYRWDGDSLLLVATHNTPPALAQSRRSAPFRPGPETPTGRMVTTKSVTHVADLALEPGYVERDPMFVEGVEVGGIRTLLSVPIVKENELIGAFSIYRDEVRPFTDKQIELVQNFAAQAVIAIENSRLLNDLRESLQQQTATSDVLKVISSSPGNLEPVFQAMLEKATQLCEAKFGVMFRFADGVFRATSWLGNPPAHIIEQPHVVSENPHNLLTRIVSTKQPVHSSDLTKERAYIEGNPRYVALVEAVGARSLLVVPMVKNEDLIGAIAIYWQEARSFTEKQMELISNFAAQAVIAIDNARLLSELRESLQQQTATADVLKVIASSTGELRPVFNAMLENAARICEAEFGALLLFEAGKFRMVAMHNVPRAFAELRRDETVFVPGPSNNLVLAVQSKAVQHVADLRLHTSYIEREPAAMAIADVAGARTLVVVPMLKDNEPIGTISIYRQEVRPFTDNQIGLVKNFAAQAVIAIENARLLSELRESLQQQTATADVLKVISRSAFDLQTVLDTLVESATRLCEAESGHIFRRTEEIYELAACHGYSREYEERMGRYKLAPGRESLVGRIALEGRMVHIPDVLADPEYSQPKAQTLGQWRTMIGVPLMRDGNPIGALTLTRSSVRPFTDKQIELLTTFADQAVIAIENVRLFESVEARTRELAASLENLRTTQDRLVQTQKLASLGQLTAGIAHEIKNPLNFVNNFSGVSAELVDELQEALKDSSLNETRRSEIAELMDTLRSNLDKVVQHGQRADAIVKNMLLHSHQGSGERRPVDVNALIEESFNLAYHGARADKQNFNVMVERSLDPAAGKADLFPQEITRVLLNLISNGVYATAKKAQANDESYKPTLIASTKSLGDRIEIKIRDNGTGISPEIKDKMFNPFFTTKPPGEGTGLGLSISHDIVVKQHAGSIEVDTQPGKFTEVRIILPRTTASISK